jgi:taurine dioxygenase
VQPTILSPIGIELTDLEVSEVTRESAIFMQALLATHGVLVLRRQKVDDGGFVDLLSRFGRLQFSKGEQPLTGFPDLNLISNVGRRVPPRSVFHVDTSYVSRPPAYTALRAVDIPAQGGETLFTNQSRAYETVPESVRFDLKDRTITHVMTGLDLGADDEVAADHQALRRHPISQRIALYISTPERCVAISDMPDAEARTMIKFLYDHSTTADNVYRHKWAAGDVVMWDNRCVLHRGDHSGVVGDRVLHRGMVADSAADSVADSAADSEAVSQI